MYNLNSINISMKIPILSLEYRVKIRIVYKSGYYHDMWVKDLTEQNLDKELSWTHVSDDNRALDFSSDNIAGIFQINSKRVIVWN